MAADGRFETELSTTSLKSHLLRLFLISCRLQPGELITTSAKEVMFYRAFVCLLANSRKNYCDRTVVKISPEMYLCKGRTDCILEVTRICIRIQEFVEGFFAIADMRYAIFPQFGSSLEKLIGSSLKFYHRCIFGQGSPREIFWKFVSTRSPHMDSESDRIHLGGGLRFPSALVTDREMCYRCYCTESATTLFSYCCY